MPPGLYVGLSSGNVGIGTTGIAGTSNAVNLTTSGASGAITVLANGNVGIGTTNPQASLHVNGYIRTSEPIAFSYGITGATTILTANGDFNGNPSTTNTLSQTNLGVFKRFNTKIYDRTVPTFNTATGLFTAPVAGIYYFIANIHVYTGTPTTLNGGIVKNGVPQAWSAVSASSINRQCPVIVILSLSANDLVGWTCAVNQHVYGADNYSTFSGYLIC